MGKVKAFYHIILMEKQFIGALKSLNKNEIIVMINYIKQV